MCNADHEAIVIGYYEKVWKDRRPDRIPDYFSATYHNNAGSRGRMVGPAGIEKNYHDLVAGFPDVSFEIADIICDGDKVVVRYVMLGTHTGPYQGAPPSHAKVTVPGIGIYRVADGFIQESWVLRDSLALMKQIGIDRLST